MTSDQEFLKRDAFKVNLHPEEIEFCRAGGVRRNENGKARGWKSMTSTTEMDWHFAGCLGEYAVGLAYNLRVSDFGRETFDQTQAGDLPGGLEVKTARSQEPARWNLVVNQTQLKVNRIYVNVLVGFQPDVYVLGYASGERILAEGRKLMHSGTGHPILVLGYQGLERPIKLFEYLRQTLGRCHPPSMQFQGLPEPGVVQATKAAGVAFPDAGPDPHAARPPVRRIVGPGANQAPVPWTDFRSNPEYMKASRELFPQLDGPRPPSLEFPE